MLDRHRTSIARTLAGDSLTGWSRYLREADEIIEEARDVIEWRFDFAFPDRVLHLARLLADHHARQREANDLPLFR